MPWTSHVRQLGAVKVWPTSVDDIMRMCVCGLAPGYLVTHLQYLNSLSDELLLACTALTAYHKHEDSSPGGQIKPPKQFTYYRY